MAHATAADAHDDHHDHAIPLWGLFLALLALTAAEVALFEVWSQNQWIMPKYAMVLLLLIFTLPKAAIVLIYFMHLKFEKTLIIVLALLPFGMAIFASLTVLIDTRTLMPRAEILAPGLGQFELDHGHGGHHGDDHHDHDHDKDHGHHAKPAEDDPFAENDPFAEDKAAPDPNDPFAEDPPANKPAADPNDPFAD